MNRRRQLKQARAHLECVRVLRPWAEAEADDFRRVHGWRGNCSCHISPPCDSCTHPGHPENLGSDDDAWRHVWQRKEAR